MRCIYADCNKEEHTITNKNGDLHLKITNVAFNDENKQRKYVVNLGLIHQHSNANELINAVVQYINPNVEIKRFVSCFSQ